MFWKLFSKSSPVDNPVTEILEPTYPGEHFTIFRLEMPEGLAFATINQAYDHYPNKLLFPWCTQLILAINNKNSIGHPTNREARQLNDLEDKIARFLKKRHQVHYIGRVTRNGFRDLFYYLDQPMFDHAETEQFLESIKAERGVYFKLERDENWEFVSAFIK